MSHPEATRHAAMDAYSRGVEAVADIAVRLGVSVSTLYRWRKLQEQTNDLKPRAASSGRPPKVGPAGKDTLRQLVVDHPHQTLAVYVRLLHEATGIVVSEVTLGRVLRRLGLDDRASRSEGQKLNPDMEDPSRHF